MCAGTAISLLCPTMNKWSNLNRIAQIHNTDSLWPVNLMSTGTQHINMILVHIDRNMSISLYCIGMTLFYSGLPETRLAAFLAMIVFIGIYLGVVFLISGAAILSLKELSEAADSKEKYRILRRIGVDEKKIRHSLLAQSGVFFAMPLLLAIVHSVFGMQTAMFILTAFGRGGLLGSILLAATVILVIYGIYFVITYICSRKIISE